MPTTRRSFSFGAVAGVSALACPSLARAAEPIGVNVFASNTIHWPQFVAKDRGFYAKEGFDAELTPVASTPQSLQMAIAGAVDVANAQPEVFIAAVQNGAADLAAIAAPMTRPDWVLVGSPGVANLAALKGKLVGLSALKTAEAWLTKRLMANHGFADADYSFINSGPSPAKVLALKTGAIGAAVLFQPAAEFALREGLPSLAAYAEMREYPTTLYVVRRSWAARNEAGPRLSRVIQAAHAFLWDPANRAEAVAIGAKYTQRDAAIIDAVYEDYFIRSKSFSRLGHVELAGLKAVLADMAETGEIFKSPPAPEGYVLEARLGGLSR